MRSRPMSALFLLLGLAGCGGSASAPVDPSQFKAPTAEEQAAIQAYDAEVNEAEFGKPMPKSKGAAKKK